MWKSGIQPSVNTIASGPSVFDRDIPAFDVAGLGQTVAKRSQQRWCGFRTGIKKADHRYR